MLISTIFMHNLILSTNFLLTIEARQRLALRKPRARPWTLNLHVKTRNVPPRPSASLNMLSNLRGVVQMKLFCLKWFPPVRWSSPRRVKNARGECREYQPESFRGKVAVVLVPPQSDILQANVNILSNLKLVLWESRGNLFLKVWRRGKLNLISI